MLLECSVQGRRERGLSMQMWEVFKNLVRKHGGKGSRGKTIALMGDWRYNRSYKNSVWWYGLDLNVAELTSNLHCASWMKSTTLGHISFFVLILSFHSPLHLEWDGFSSDQKSTDLSSIQCAQHAPPHPPPSPSWHDHPNHIEENKQRNFS